MERPWLFIVSLDRAYLEGVYEVCFCHELKLRNIPFERQKKLPINYKGIRLNAARRTDVLLGGQVLVELKAVAAILPVHEAQLLTYLKLGGWSLGLIINFNVALLKDGLRRKVLGFQEAEPASPPRPLRLRGKEKERK